ncbi:MAG: hypothetical protein ACYTGZ_21415 [Planctomycetota bacterium]
MTDVAGRVWFDDPQIRSVDVFLDPGGGFAPLRVRNWRPRKGRNKMKAVLYGPHELVVRVAVDGVPGLPDGFKFERLELIGETRDPATGVVRGKFIPRGPAFLLEVSAPGYLGQMNGQLVDIPRSSRVCTAKVTLSRPVDLRIHIRGKSALADRVCVMREYPGFGWGRPRGERQNRLEHLGRSRWARIWRTTAGRFRVVLDKYVTGIVLTEFDVPVGAESKKVTVDLRDASWLRFETVLPADYKATGPITVDVEGRGIRPRAFSDASKKIVHPGDRDLTLTLRAPLLAPHPAHGKATVQTGGTVKLRAIRGPLLTFDWPPHDRSRRHVRFFPVDPSLEEFRGGRAWRAEDGYARGNLPVGMYHVVVRHGTRWPPVVFRNVSLRGEAVKLGTITPTLGGTLKLRLRGIPQFERPLVTVLMEDPHMVLESLELSADQPELTIGSLPAGALSVHVRVGDREIPRAFGCDGKSDHALEIDCAER